MGSITYILLLFVNIPNLEPNIDMCERIWRISQDAVEAREALVVLPLLLVNDAKGEIDFAFLIRI